MEDESLLNRTLKLSHGLGTLRSLAAFRRHAPVLPRIVDHQVTRLLLHPKTEDASDNLFFNLLGCTPTAYTKVLQENHRGLPHTLHLDKNKAVNTAPCKYIPLFKEDQRNLSDWTLKTIYVCCGMPGVRRNCMGLRTWRQCDPFHEP